MGSTPAYALEFAEVKSTAGCTLTVVPIQAHASTYIWHGECVNGKAEGLGTFVHKLRVDENLFDLYYSTQTRHEGIAYGYTTLNTTRRNTNSHPAERVTFNFNGSRIAFTNGWGWSLEGLLVGDTSMSLPRPAPPQAFPLMSIESPTRLLNLSATTCAADQETLAACKGISDRNRTMYVIREYEADRNAFKLRTTTPCPDIFDIASCQPLLVQKSAPLRAEILAFLERAKPSVDVLLAKARASRPAERSQQASARLPPPLAEASIVPPTPGTVDAPLPVFDTKVPFPSQLGAMLWLDENTLAITTSPDHEFWNGKTLAVDVAARSVSVILEHGFLNCTNDGLVAMTKGSLAHQYAGGFLKADAQRPVNVFYRWNSKAKRLESEEPASKLGWSWHICTQTRPEDIRRAAISYYGHNIRYLKPRDGVLQWSAADSSSGATPVFLAKPGSVPIPVDVDGNDFAPTPVYLPFSDQYLLTAGRFVTGGAKIGHRGKMVDQLPAITMTADGRVTRLMLPESLKAALDVHGAESGVTRPTAAGLLINVGARPAKGGGLYLSKANTVKRVWCLPSVRGSASCSLERLELSPDGCQLAFVSGADVPKTVNIMRLCSSAGEK